MTDNVICDNCLGSRLYEANGKQFKNPFQWCVIKPLDMIYLMEEYDSIDFRRHELMVGTLNGMEFLKTRVDGCFDVWWVHHIKDEAYDEPTKVDNPSLRNADLKYRHIETYINETYERRVERMGSSKPTFIVNFDNYWGMYDNDVVKIGKMTTKKDDTILVSSDRKCDELGCQLSIVLPNSMDYDNVANILVKNNYCII